jgi:hypothetical protein
MKNLILNSIFAFLILGTSVLMAQDWPEEYLGLPGDNLNLYAVMDLFQNSETLEGFERSLNDPEKMINNLDLNNDNLVDYIMVFDYFEENVHTIVLRVALNKNEMQDVAVFTIEKLRNGSVLVQLIGDEALYGHNYIIEPAYAETPNPGYKGNVTYAHSTETVVTTSYHEVSNWPIVVYIYKPSYRPWYSLWSWGYYPEYWYPWTPHYWHYYYGYHNNLHVHYYTYYRPWRYHRCESYHNVYYGRIRRHSPTVVVNVNSGRYKNTYNRPERKVDGQRYYSQRYPNGNPQIRKGREVNVREINPSNGTNNQVNTDRKRPDNRVNSRPERINTTVNTNNTQTVNIPRSGNTTLTGREVRNSGSSKPAPQRVETNVKRERTEEQPRRTHTATRPSSVNSNSSERNVNNSSSRESNSNTSNRVSSSSSSSTSSSSTNRERPTSTSSSSSSSNRERPASTSSSSSSSSRERPASTSVNSSQPAKSETRTSNTSARETKSNESKSSTTNTTVGAGSRKR